jgi:rhamnulokinase
MKKNAVSVAAVDLGATSGRVFNVKWDGNRLDLKEAHRFFHGFERLGKHYYWQPGNLFREIVNGLQACCREFPNTISCGVDTWGVDCALILKDGRLAHPVYAYRDERTRPLMPDPESAEAKDIYARTGIPPVVYNTSIQLAETLNAMPALRESVSNCLLLPDLMNYFLCGTIRNEVSIASTGQLLSLDTLGFDALTLKKYGIPTDWFNGPALAGERLGTVQEEKGLDGVTVSLVPGHDTGLPGGVSHERCGNGKFRPTKILMGLWLVEKLLESFQAKPSSAEEWMQLDEAVAATEMPDYVLDTSDTGLFNPRDMQEAIDAQLSARGLPKPQSLPAYLRLAAESVGQSIADAMGNFESALGKHYDRVVLIGGGAKNPILCQAIASRAKRKVVAFPTEAAVIGNAAYQFKAMDIIESVEDFRSQLVDQIEPRIFE